MKSFAVAAMALVTSAVEVNEARFIEFLAKHGKSYKSSEEFDQRLNRWMHVDAEIEKLNASEQSSTHGHNYLSDYLEHELANMRGTRKDTRDANTPVFKASSNQTFPSAWDWIVEGAVSPVLDQGQCNAAWAFAAAGALEGANFIFNALPALVELSPQQFISCSIPFGN